MPSPTCLQPLGQSVRPAAADRVSTVSGGPNIPQNLQKVRIYI